jgi:hypothetical protein
MNYQFAISLLMLMLQGCVDYASLTVDGWQVTLEKKSEETGVVMTWVKLALPTQKNVSFANPEFRSLAKGK